MGEQATKVLEKGASALHALSAEIVNLLYEQAFSSGEARTEEEICESFAEILLRHWDLCCVATYLPAADGRLRECAGHTHQRVPEAEARRVADLLAAQVERTGAEFHFWPGQGPATLPAVREAFAATTLEAGVGVPIRAHGELAGALVVCSTDAGRLRAALDGVRCLGPAVVIAIGNARRGAAMDAQHRRIEALVGESRRHAAALEEANRELQRVSRYRSLFLARMSHELRTPLTSILGFAEILLDHEDLTGSQRRFCEKIQSSGFQLQASLNQLVDLSRLEAGQTELFLHEFSLRETLRESCAAVARLAQKQGVKLECASAPEVGGLLSDEGKLRQVLYNFLAFAIGRSPAGGRVTVTAAPADGERLRVEISDQGEPLTDPAHLFDPVDVDAPSERGTNMNELGLAIAHRLLHALGGHVTLRDAEPRGLHVTLNLPARPQGK
ncbi:MAG TPA: HAMP domain-containing sensor histidine kinase [Pyrinomonadaceae bacterium]|nr:HAMP domain-containing sensor histidine kinase [Pyrinomonadaceae bacterium]